MSHLAGEGLNERKVAQFKTAVLVFSARNMPRRGWYHIGTRCNNNLRQFILLGSDVGFDSINGRPMAEALSNLFSKCDNSQRTRRSSRTNGICCRNPFSTA